MGMGTRRSQAQQEQIWITNVEMVRSPGHPFYQRLNELLDKERFDAFVKDLRRANVTTSTEDRSFPDDRQRAGAQSDIAQLPPGGENIRAFESISSV